MKKYRENKAKKLLAGLGERVQGHIEACIELYARDNAKGNEVSAAGWRNRIAGVLTGLHLTDVITIKEEMLLNEYAINRAWDMAEEIKNGVA